MSSPFAYRLSRSRAARVVGALAALTAWVAGSLTTGSEPAQAASRHAKTTKIVMTVKGCDGCSVSLYQSYDVSYSWGVGPKTIKNGKLVVTVPRTRTKALAIDINDPKAVNTNAGNLIVFRYANQRAGKPITKMAASKADFAFTCAAEVYKPVVRWHLSVDHLPGTDFLTGKKGFIIRPYMSPGVRTFGYSQPAEHGVVQVQDGPFCNTAPN